MEYARAFTVINALSLYTHMHAQLETKPSLVRKSSPCFLWFFAPLHQEKLVNWPDLGWSCWYSWSGRGAGCWGGQLLLILWRIAQVSDRTVNPLLSSMNESHREDFARLMILVWLRILWIIQQSDLHCKKGVRAHLLGALMVQLLAGESSSEYRRPTGCYDHDGLGFPPGFCVSGWPAKPWFQMQSCQGLLLGAENQKISRLY